MTIQRSSCPLIKQIIIPWQEALSKWFIVNGHVRLHLKSFFLNELWSVLRETSLHDDSFRICGFTSTGIFYPDAQNHSLLSTDWFVVSPRVFFVICPEACCSQKCNESWVRYKTGAYNSIFKQLKKADTPNTIRFYSCSHFTSSFLDLKVSPARWLWNTKITRHFDCANVL